METEPEIEMFLDHFFETWEKVERNSYAPAWMPGRVSEAYEPRESEREATSIRYIPRRPTGTNLVERARRQGVFDDVDGSVEDYAAEIVVEGDNHRTDFYGRHTAETNRKVI